MRLDKLNKRILQSLRLCFIGSARKRAEYLRKNCIFGSIGSNCSIMNRKVPLYANLIKIGNNVHLATGVDFTTHDAIHIMLNNMANDKFSEKIGCIEIGNNVFIGAFTQILYDVKIGSNVIIGAGSIVTKDIPDNSIAVGVPAKVIGSFEDFVKKRKKNKNIYQERINPKNQIVCKELEDILWQNFYNNHKC